MVRHQAVGEREVLIAEAANAPFVGARCQLAGGVRVSPYDGMVLQEARLPDVDHLVPLAEVWDSGASTRLAEQRQACANYLAEPHAGRGLGEGEPVEGGQGRRRATAPAGATAAPTAPTGPQ